MRPLNTRLLADVCHQARQRAPLSRKGKFLVENKLNNKHHKMYRQFAKCTGNLLSPRDRKRIFHRFRQTAYERDERGHL